LTTIKPYLVFAYSIQCNGYTEGGVVGSEPAAIYATVAAGSTIDLQWTPWPESHIVRGSAIVAYYAVCST